MKMRRISWGQYYCRAWSVLIAGSIGVFICLDLPGVEISQDEDARLHVPVRIRVAVCEDGPVKSVDWVESHVNGANRIFQPHGIVLNAEVDTFRPAKCELITREDRQHGASFVADRKVHVLIMARIQDLDVSDYNLMGVHWRYRGPDIHLKGRRWIYLTARAKPPVLAHELCHFFGVPHDRNGGNLMTPGPSDPIWKKEGTQPRPYRPRLFPYQVRKLIKGIERYQKMSP